MSLELKTGGWEIDDNRLISGASGNFACGVEFRFGSCWPYDTLDEAKATVIKNVSVIAKVVPLISW